LDLRFPLVRFPLLYADSSIMLMPCIRRAVSGSVALILAGALLFLAALAQAPGDRRVIAIGDVHGNLDGLVAILQKMALIDKNRHWSGGNATLVQTGDLLDRGPQSRAVLDLMMTLQKEAPRQNGSVRVSLGNHEVMNIMGDLRYVVPADYAAFANSRSASRNSQRHPAGFLERQEAFGPRGMYGRWLRSLPAINMVDGAIFLHGGIAPELAAWTVDKINSGVRNEIRAFDKYKQFMVEKGLAQPFSTFDELVAAAKTEIARQPANQTADDLETLNQFLRYGAWLTINGNGPLWFRGYDSWSEQEGESNISRLLDAFRITRVVVGHTPQENGEIRSRFGGKVFLIDTGMLSSNYPGGKAAALEISKAGIRAIYLDTPLESGAAQAAPEAGPLTATRK
jgi:hypothetical protein